MVEELEHRQGKSVSETCLVCRMSWRPVGARAMSRAYKFLLGKGFVCSGARGAAAGRRPAPPAARVFTP